MKALILSTLALVAAAPMALQAKPFQSHAGASINQRQIHQESRLAQGVRSGELTVREARSLAHNQNRIAATEARMRADGGGLSQRERGHLQSALNRQSVNIFNQKHDQQDRTPHRR